MAIIHISANSNPVSPFQKPKVKPKNDNKAANLTIKTITITILLMNSDPCIRSRLFEIGKKYHILANQNTEAVKLCWACFMPSVMGNAWGKKLAQNNSKPVKVAIRLALMLCGTNSGQSGISTDCHELLTFIIMGRVSAVMMR